GWPAGGRKPAGPVPSKEADLVAVVRRGGEVDGAVPVDVARRQETRRGSRGDPRGRRRGAHESPRAVPEIDRYACGGLPDDEGGLAVAGDVGGGDVGWGRAPAGRRSGRGTGERRGAPPPFFAGGAACGPG